MIFLIIL